MLSQVLDVYQILDRSKVKGEDVIKLFKPTDRISIYSKTIYGEKDSTDFIKIVIKGSNGKMGGGKAPTLGLIGRLEGLGANPEKIGFISDGDGALTVIAVALKLFQMSIQEDYLNGDIIISTNICAKASIIHHDPVPFVNSPINDTFLINKLEVDQEMDAILSVDTTKGNRIMNYKGFAITPTIKEGYILKVSDDLLNIMENTTGKLPKVLPITMQDITPYGNGIYHLNTMLQPSILTSSPVAGVAITSEISVSGCATGATHLTDIELAAKFCLEVAKYFGKNSCAFYDRTEFDKLKDAYGDMSHLQSLGKR